MEIVVRSNKKKGSFFHIFGLKGLSIDRNLITLDELTKMDTSNIYIALDKNIFNSDLSFLEKALISLDKLKIKGIFFYDLSVLSLSKKLNIKVPLIWNQNFLVTNYRTCNYYKKEGVSGAVVSSEITIDEVITILKNTDIDLFVNIFGYQLMAVSKRHLLGSYFEYVGEENYEQINYMSEKTGKYRVIEEDYGTKFLSKNILNGIRYINKLKDAGVKYIILDDYGIDDDIFSKIFEYFNLAVNGVSDLELMEMERNIGNLVPTTLGFFDKKTIYKVKMK